MKVLSRFPFRQSSRPLLGAVAAGLVAASVAACSGGTSAEPADGSGPVDVTIAQNPTAAALFIDVADKQGFFKKNGLNVTIQTVDNMALMPAAIASNQYTFANIVPPLFLNARLQHLPVVAVAGGNLESTDDPQFGTMVPAGSPIRTLADLKGKKVATATIQGNLSQCLQWALKQSGTDPAAVKLQVVPFNDMKSQLDAKQVDAAIMQTPLTTGLAKQGYRSIMDPCQSVGSPQQTSFQIANAEWAKDHPTAVKAFQQSIAEAGQWEKDHPDEAKKLLAEWSGQPSEVTDTFVPPTIVGTPPTAEDLGHWSDVLVALGAMKGKPDLSGAIFTD